MTAAAANTLRPFFAHRVGFRHGFAMTAKRTLPAV
jgi:hypothetical protein